MESVIPPHGYTLPDGWTPEDVLAVGAELLHSEGIDPAWPPFTDESGQPIS